MGSVLGTVAYMSPEQLRAKPVDARSDIFSLGAILYEMLTGQRPFHGETDVDTITAVLKETPPDVTRERADVPTAFEHIVVEQRIVQSHDTPIPLDAAMLKSRRGSSGD